MVAINHVLCAYVQVFIILSIILFFKLHRGTWSPWSFQTLTGIWPYCKMAFSTTVSMCAEWLVFFFSFPSSSPLPPSPFPLPLPPSSFSFSFPVLLLFSFPFPPPLCPYLLLYSTYLWLVCLITLFLLCPYV